MMVVMKSDIGLNDRIESSPDFKEGVKVGRMQR